MTGVRVGSRLERLIQLRTKIDQEIAAEARAAALRAPAKPQPEPKPGVAAPVCPPSTGDALLVELGVTGNEVKLWAVSVGLVDKVNRGPCPNSLIDEYATAHREIRE